jgi:hypothetical protein
MGPKRDFAGKIVDRLSILGLSFPPWRRVVITLSPSFGSSPQLFPAHALGSLSLTLFAVQAGMTVIQPARTKLAFYLPDWRRAS